MRCGIHDPTSIGCSYETSLNSRTTNQDVTRGQTKYWREKFSIIETKKYRIGEENSTKSKNSQQVLLESNTDSSIKKPQSHLDKTQSKKQALGVQYVDSVIFFFSF